MAAEDSGFYFEDSGFYFVDSGFQALDSSLCQWNLDSGFQSLVKFGIPQAEISWISLHGVGGAQRACSQVTLNCVVVVVCLLVFFWISSWSREDHAH